MTGSDFRLMHAKVRKKIGFRNHSAPYSETAPSPRFSG